MNTTIITINESPHARTGHARHQYMSIAESKQRQMKFGIKFRPVKGATSAPLTRTQAAMSYPPSQKGRS